jgi:hypothetical protein
MIRERSAKEKTENLIIYLLQTRITEGFPATPYLLPHTATPSKICVQLLQSCTLQQWPNYHTIATPFHKETS